MSAMPPIAIQSVRRNEASRCAHNDRMQRSKKAVLFDRFVGPHKQCWRDIETECLRVFAQVSTAKPRHGRPMAGFLRSVRGGSLHPSHAIQMSRLATTSTIPVMSTAKQENSRRSLRSICILPPPLTSRVPGHLDTPRYCPWFAVRLRNHHESFHAFPHAAFPAIFFAAIIGVIVLIALTQVLLDPHE